MKKLAQCAVLLAFALAFVGCNTQDEKSESLQDALNDGGTVNLDEYKFSSKNAYTISGTSIITGDAKNVSFVIADGADVTFDSTKNIGTVTAGGSNTRNAAVRAATRTAGVKISLKGNGVTISKMFIKVDCTFTSNNANNSFGSVIVAETVTNLALEGNTKVAALVSTGEANVKITVSTTVTIEKADTKVIASVKENNPNITIDIPEISEGELKDLQDDLEEEEKQEPNNNGDNIIKSKADLTACVKNIIREYYKFARDYQNGNRTTKNRAVQATTQDPTAQLIAFMKGISKFEDAIAEESWGGGDSSGTWEEHYKGPLVPFFEGDGAEEDFHSDITLNVINIGINEGLDAYIAALNDVRKSIAAEKGEDEPRETTRESLFDDDVTSVNAVLNVADNYVSIPKLYAHVKFDVNKDNTNNYASLTAKADTQANITNINRLIPELFEAYNDTVKDMNYVPSSANLPVKEIKSSVKVDANVALTKKQYDDFVQICRNAPSFDCDFYNKYTGDYSDYEAYDKAHDAYHEQLYRQEKEYFLQASYPTPTSFKCELATSVSATVTSSASVPGGIITFSLEANCTPAQLTAFYARGSVSSDYVEVLKELEKDYGIKPTITVTDYNGKQTLKLSGLNEILDIITDIVENIGEIIQ